MIEKDKVSELVKTHLPQAEDEIIQRITCDVIRDADAVIRSMVRQAVAQERENLYRKNSKD